MSRKLFKPTKGSLRRSGSDTIDEVSEFTSKVITWDKQDGQGKSYGFLEKSVFSEREDKMKNVFLHEGNLKVPETIEEGDYVHYTLISGSNLAKEVFKVPKPKQG